MPTSTAMRGSFGGGGAGVSTTTGGGGKTHRGLGVGELHDGRLRLGRRLFRRGLVGDGEQVDLNGRRQRHRAGHLGAAFAPRRERPLPLPLIAGVAPFDATCHPRAGGIEANQHPAWGVLPKRIVSQLAHDRLAKVGRAGTAGQRRVGLVVERDEQVTTGARGARAEETERARARAAEHARNRSGVASTMLPGYDDPTQNIHRHGSARREKRPDLSFLNEYGELRRRREACRLGVGGRPTSTDDVTESSC